MIIPAEGESSLLIEELWDAPKALLLADLLRSSGKNILVISAGQEENALLLDLPYFGVENPLDFPSWETLPSDDIAPSPDIVGKRFSVLHTLLTQQDKPHLVIAPLQACLQKVVPPSLLAPLFAVWRVGNSYPFSQLTSHLISLGYRQRPVASDKGEFAMRGGIIDIFPVSSTDPYRIEFFGEEIEQIRTYDPIGQKSTGKVDAFFLSPASEMAFLQKKSAVDILPYLGQNTLLVFDDLLALEDRAVSLKTSSPFILSMEEFIDLSSSFPRLWWSKEPIEELSETKMAKRIGRAYYSGKDPLQPLSFHLFGKEIQAKRWRHPFSHPLSHPGELRSLSPYSVHFIASSDAEERTLRERLKNEEFSLTAQHTFERGYLSEGFVWEEKKQAFIPTAEFTHRAKLRREKWRSSYHTPTSDFHELIPGDIVVHFQQGIAKYLGIEKKPNHLGVQSEFLTLEYAQNSKLYVPMASAHLVSRYIGAKEELPVLHTLGSTRWERTRGQAQKAIIGFAHDLLKLQAERAVKGGFIYPSDGPDMEAFEGDFPYIETEDQLRAIADIKQEMTSGKAMDRLICGDVGYGKTEVAMRAAFKAAYEGKKQVAVLVPTTILAMQHFETFSARMENFPLSIGLLCRFCPPKEIKKTLKAVAEGSIDIVIGTHRIVSKDVRFKDLGLLIIDEEQRFGVRAKEHLKALKTGVDCLTLSATPIPRTLYLSLTGARDISTINTPPQDRLPIKTILAEKTPEGIKQALLRELSRDGQVFFIHNRVETISQVSDELQKLLPEARIIIAHGQMPPEAIDLAFHTFKEGRADILLSTTIIENGIDIPNANTIIIDRADRFGLADLYQLRGRVGRSNRPAYAYFLTPPGRILPEIGGRRLKALFEASGFGGGMKIALRDLEIRGAGDILGVQQSGQIAAIGFHLYCKLLKRTVEALRKKVPLTFTETKIEFPYEAALPETYIGESSLRMEIYYRLGEATIPAEIDDILAELKDRFGTPPPPVLWLHHLTRLRLFASEHHFTLLKFETHTFTAERNKVKKVLSTPRTKKPTDWEAQALEQLKEAFKL